MQDRSSAFFRGLVGQGTESLPARGVSTGAVDLRDGGRLLVISDFHMGDGRRDDLERNGALVRAILDNYYFERGYTLVLNGDIEELLKYSLAAIRARWHTLYLVFDRFNRAGRLYKILGNHDAALAHERGYPYRLYETVTARTESCDIHIYHGHQGSAIYSRFPKLIAGIVRYGLKPFGIGNITSARSPRKRFAAEKRAYDFSLAAGVLSIIGHTHRSLFESLGRYEYIKYEIERHCRAYPAASDEERRHMKQEVTALRGELAKLGKKERRDSLRSGLYGGDVPVPCLFNAGCVIGRKGINAIELDNETISLVYWWEEDKGKKFVRRGGYTVEQISGGAPSSAGSAAPLYSKAALNTEKLAYIKTRMELLR